MPTVAVPPHHPYLLSHVTQQPRGAEYQAEDTFGFTDARNFYRCVEEVPESTGTPAPAPGRCGGFNQPCCNSGSSLTQCGMGLACNLGARAPCLQ